MVLVVATAACALAAPAFAQSWERQQPAPRRDFFPFSIFGGNRGSGTFFGPSGRPAPAIDYSRAPPPRKAETPPSRTILVVGDSFADWLGYGLEEAFSDTPDIGVVRKVRASSGLVRYGGHGDLEWPQVATDILAKETPSAIVVMLGLNDRESLRERKTESAAPQQQKTSPEQQPSAAAEEKPHGGAQTYEFRTDKWAALYQKRIDEMIAVLKSKGVPVVWAGLPAIRGTRSTADMSYLDDLYRGRADKDGITYVDVWDGFVDENGRYTSQGPDFEGQTRRLRSGDGIHFTKAGAVKLAHYVEHELRRLMASPVTPVALPAPTPAQPNGVRPTVGPVLPLNALNDGAGSGELLGASGIARPAHHDPLVIRALSRGDPLAAPPGRADDFSWPRRADLSDYPAVPSKATAAAPVATTPAAPTAASKPSAPVVPAVAAVPPAHAVAPPKPAPRIVSVPPAAPMPLTPPTNAGEQRETTKPREIRTQPTREAAGAATATHPRRRRLNLDGAPPRPPLPIGPAAVNGWH